jgi:hypothetical protein
MRPFRDSDTYATLRGHTEKVTAEINALDNEYVLKASPTELEQYFISKVLVKPLVLHVDHRHIENQTGVNVDVSGDFLRGFMPGERGVVRGTRLDVVIPFEGDPLFWRVRASTFSMSGYPDITIRDDSILFSVSFPDDTADPNGVRRTIDEHTNRLAEAVNYLKHDIDQHNATASNTIRQALDRKRQLARATSGVVAGLGIPIRRKDEPPAFAAPVKRRPSPAQRPAVTTGDYQPEPFLEEKEYEHILDVLRSMALVIERNPDAFATLDEEAIRTHFLLQLNGHYEGNATGETFNAAGKTDILIRVGNKNVFIAECKFWHGPKGFNDAIDQLLSYLTWRDSKCALLVFNKTKDSSGIRQKMHEAMQARPECRKTLFHQPDRDSRYVFVKASDPGREITITTQLYDVPTKTE